MPYADPDKQRAANRAAQRRSRARRGVTEKPAVEAVELPEPPSRDELLRLLGEQARSGHVVAIRTLLEEYRRDGNEDTKPKLSVVDELAARRGAGA